MKNQKVKWREENVTDALTAMVLALDTLGPALDAGLNAVKTLFCEAVRELKQMIARKPVYVNHVDIWFLRSMDPLSRDPLKLRPLLKTRVAYVIFKINNTQYVYFCNFLKTGHLFHYFSFARPAYYQLR